ncbi:MAG: 8-oxo-dGTP diphosphatase [Candidatus Hydrogenedentota bacterium]
MYTPILATLAYVMSPCRRKVLLVHRNKREDDQHFGKYNGLGGKLEPHEDIVAGAKREIREEAGIECTQLLLRGTINWPGFGKNGENWFGFIFRVDRFEGEPCAENAEGFLEWTSVNHILDLPLWEGDRRFLPLVFDDSAGQFHGVMPYEGEQFQGWWFTALL